MKRTGLLLIIGAVAGLAVLSTGAVAPVPSPESSEIKQLKKEVEALRQRVDSLEERLKEDLIPPTPKDGGRRSPFIVPAPKDGRRTPGFVIPAPGSGRVPPHWREFEFNGMTYYIVPINNTSSSASEASKQVPPSPSPATPKTADNQ
jgi:hypothetical protein